MKLSQDYEIDKESYYKSKKYVVKIFPQNIKKIEGLEVRERDQFINDAISAYVDCYNAHKKQEDLFEKVKKVILQIIYVIILFVLLGSIARFLFIYSDATSSHMQNNFQRLFDSYHLN